LVAATGDDRQRTEQNSQTPFLIHNQVSFEKAVV
jgi:hypothetical protein